MRRHAKERRSQLHVGLGTIIFGDAIEDLSGTLKAAARLGFSAVEFAQPVSCLGDPNLLQSLCATNRLKILGFAGGALRDRISYALSLDQPPPYIYLDSWNDEVAKISEEFKDRLNTAGIALAIHPYYYKSIDTIDDIRRICGIAPEIRIIADTAHMFLSGFSMRSFLDEFGDRIIAVHLKDWLPKYGRNYLTYPRGFTHLGNGMLSSEYMVPLLEWIRSGPETLVGLVVEQDHSDGQPFESLRRSLEWLNRSGLFSKAIQIAELDGVESASVSASQHSGGGRDHLAERIADRIASDMHLGFDHWYNSVCAALKMVAEVQDVCIWEVNPKEGELVLACSTVDVKEFAADVLPLSTATYTGQAVGSGTISIWDIDSHFADPRLARVRGWRSFACLPILNVFNRDQVMLAVSLFSCGCAADLKGLLPIELLRSIEKRLSSSFGMITERYLHDISEEVNDRALKIEHYRNVQRYGLDVVRQLTGCESATVFAMQEHRELIGIEESTAYNRDVDRARVSYAVGAHLIGRCWVAPKTKISHNYRELERDDPNLTEETAGRSYELLVKPLFDYKGRIRAVVRCRGKMPSGRCRSTVRFTVVDEMFIDHVQATLRPHLRRANAHQRRMDAVSAVKHELGIPITNCITMCDIVSGELSSRGVLLKENYLRDIQGYLRILAQLSEELSYLRTNYFVRVDVSEPVLLYKDVFAPAIDYLYEVFKKYGFSGDQVECDFSDLWKVYVDKQRFQHLAFNIIENALKYSRVGFFRMKISARRMPGEGFAITFTDWGIGIPAGYEKRIFEQYVRGGGEVVRKTKGDGLGLWIVRRIVDAHGGDISVTSSPTSGTSFVVTMPEARMKPVVELLAEKERGET